MWLFIGNALTSRSAKSTPSCKSFKEILRNMLSLTWGWPEVLSMAPIVQILNRWFWPELFSLSLYYLRVSLVKTNEWEGSFLFTNSDHDLCCETQRRMRLNRGGQPEDRTQVEGSKVICICIKGLKSPHLRLPGWELNRGLILRQAGVPITELSFTPAVSLIQSCWSRRQKNSTITEYEF